MPRHIQRPEVTYLLSGSVLPIAHGGTSAKDKVQAASNLSFLPRDELFNAEEKIIGDKLDTYIGPVNIDGPLQVFLNSKSTYTITDHDLTTHYRVIPLTGSVVLNNDQIEYTAPVSGTTGGFVVNDKVIEVALVRPYVTQPSITSPTTGTVNVQQSITLTSGVFSTVGGNDTHQSSDWQIATDAAFTNLVAQASESTSSLTSYTVTGLTANTTYYARVRYRGTSLTDMSAWSDATTFSTKTSFYPSVQEALFYDNSGSSGDNFGISVAVSADGNTCVVGAPSRSSYTGIAYVFKRQNHVWAQQTVLQPNSLPFNANYGLRVAISANADTAVVSAAIANDSGYNACGVVYVFTQTNDTWTQQAKLTASDPSTGAVFGVACSLTPDGNKITVGATGVASNQGAGYIFTRSGTTWAQQAKLTAADGASGDMFGTATAISSKGDLAVFSAFFKTVNGNTKQGVVYVYAYANNTWSQQAVLSSSDGAANDNFGVCVSVNSDGTLCVVGAFTKTLTYSAQGAAYVFARSGTTWSQQAAISLTDGAANDHFGESVRLNQDGASFVVGSSNRDGSGSAYLYVISSGVWVKQKTFKANDASAGAKFGYTVDISSDNTTIVVSSYLKTVNSHTEQGAVYSYI